MQALPECSQPLLAVQELLIDLLARIWRIDHRPAREFFVVANLQNQCRTGRQTAKDGRQQARNFSMAPCDKPLKSGQRDLPRPNTTKPFRQEAIMGMHTLVTPSSPVRVSAWSYHMRSF